MLQGLSKLAYRIFGRYIYRHRSKFIRLQEEMKKARLPYSLDEYISMIILLSILFFFLFFGFFMAFLTFSLTFRVLFSFFLAVGSAALIFIYLLNYPRVVAYRRAAKIDKVLPYAITHMSTLAGSGIAPHHIFRIMGKITKYGEVSRECQIIYRDVSVVGKDIFTALSDAAKSSPSRLWAEILWGISSTLHSGGSLRDYLYIKSRELRAYLERKEREAVDTMNLLTEIYLILFVLTPILGAIMLLLMGMLGGGKIFGFTPDQIFALLVYIITPITGVAFLVIADALRPRAVV
jgi:flagellar protein FlaJ